MNANLIEIKPDFKKNLQKAIFAIGLFILIYLILFAVGVLITAVSFILGIGIIAIHPSFITLFLGIGLFGMGGFVMVFLIKFIFKRNVIDRSHLIEIKAKDEPQLFALIQEIVEEANTQFPKRVYLSGSVNAAVFYDSSFWSMFFPIKKNLEIGLGLVNGINQSEFKAILAHEFGHFSQGSMKVGSYVYQVNQVIYNLLYENDAYGRWIQRWSSISTYFAIFMYVAVKIIQAIQWVLRQMYNFVNLSYMSLSRSMEFHADEVAANIAGSAPLVSALAKTEFLDTAFETVLNHYNAKIGDGIKTQNVYPRHRFVMQFLAKEKKYTLKDDLPCLKPGEANTYDKSQLVVSEQWASHPSTLDRIAALEALNIQEKQDGSLSANLLFEQLPQWQSQLTSKMFAGVTYAETPVDDDLEEFEAQYVQKYLENSFEPAYNGYYDRHNPVAYTVEEMLTQEVDPVEQQLEALFSPDQIDMMYSTLSLENDLLTIQSIQKGTLSVQSFDFEGKKYSVKEAAMLIPSLEDRLDLAKEQVKKHDLEIFWFFYRKAQAMGQGEELLTSYRFFLELDRTFIEKKQLYLDLMNAVNFIREETPYDEIEDGLDALKPIEMKFQYTLEEILGSATYQPFLEDSAVEIIQKYLSQQWVYFTKPVYDDQALVVLFDAIHAFYQIVDDSYFKAKKALLSFQIDLVK